MLNVENVATPLTAFTLVVPDNVPPPGFAPIATVIAPVNPVTTFPDVSRAATRTGGIVCPASVDWGCVVNTRFAAGGGGGGGSGGGGGGGGAMTRSSTGTRSCATSRSAGTITIVSR